jgi:hypothetical protein
MPLCEREPLNIALVLVSVLLCARLYFVDLGGSAAHLRVLLGWPAAADGLAAGGGGAAAAGPAPHARAQLVTPTPIPGPQSLRPLLGRCSVFKTPSGGPSIEFCGYKSVRQVYPPPQHRSFWMGYFKGWATGPDGVTLVGQEYVGGTHCPGFRDRETLVKFVCRASAAAPELVAFEEDGNAPCKYQLTVATRLWCGMEEGAAGDDAAAASPRALASGPA